MTGCDALSTAAEAVSRVFAADASEGRDRERSRPVAFAFGAFVRRRSTANGDAVGRRAGEPGDRRRSGPRRARGKRAAFVSFVSFAAAAAATASATASARVLPRCSPRRAARLRGGQRRPVPARANAARQKHLRARPCFSWRAASPRRRASARAKGSVFEPESSVSRVSYRNASSSPRSAFVSSAARAPRGAPPPPPPPSRAPGARVCLGTAERRTRERLVGSASAVLAAGASSRRRLLRSGRHATPPRRGRRARTPPELAQPGLERRLLDRERRTERAPRGALRRGTRQARLRLLRGERAVASAAPRDRRAGGGGSRAARRGACAVPCDAASSRAARLRRLDARRGGASALLGRASSRAGLVDGLEGPSFPGRVEFFQVKIGS